MTVEGADRSYGPDNQLQGTLGCKFVTEVHAANWVGKSLIVLLVSLWPLLEIT